MLLFALKIRKDKCLYKFCEINKIFFILKIKKETAHIFLEHKQEIHIIVLSVQQYIHGFIKFFFLII